MGQSVETELALEDPEVTKEPPQSAEVTNAGKITQVPEVNIEPRQIDPSSSQKMFADGEKNSIWAGAGVVLKSPEGAISQHCLGLNFLATNNKVKYEAFIAGLWSANKLKILQHHIFNNSKLVVNQCT